MIFKKFVLKMVYVFFDDIIKLEDFDFDNIFLDEKSNKNILVYEISYKAFIGLKTLLIRFEKVDGLIRIQEESRYLS